MDIKIGVIGPKDSVDKIMEVTEAFASDASFMPAVYSSYEEVVTLVEDVQKRCDAVFFSGEAPYQVALNNGVLVKPSVYIPREGTSFYRTIWEIQRRQMAFKRLSSDVVSEAIIAETMEELEIEYEKTYHLPYKVELSPESIIHFHRTLWNEGKIDAVITGFTGVYNTLNAEGIPTYKIYPTKSLIREALNKIILLGRVKREQAAQIAIQVIKLKVSEENASSEYTFMLLRNKLEQNLIKYTQQNFGALFPLGRDEYLLFTNRGSVEKIPEIFESQFGDNFQNMILSSGIGFGYTVYDAESNARSALRYAMKKEHHCIYMKDEKGTLTGPFTSEANKWLEYNLEAGRDVEIASIAEQSGISASYISKLQGLMRKINRETVDANVVSNYLGISPRSARRILTTLTEAGYAQIDYSEAKAQTGRPRKIYTLKI